MKRRSFLSHSLKGALVPFFMSGSGMARMARATFLPAGVCAYDDRVLVVIHLNGANDIINSTVPLSQFGQYRDVYRRDIFIPEDQLITLDASLPENQQIGLHPGLQVFKDLYDDGQLAILQRAGYPVPNRSHFSSQAIWLKGVDGNGGINTEEEGWIGRFLKDRYPTFSGLPFGDQLDPLGIMLGSGADTGFHSNEDHDFHINLAGQDPAGFYNIISSISGEPIESFPMTDQGEMLQYMAAIEKSTQVYSGRISSVFNAGTNSSNANYGNDELSNQLKTIARFLSGGSTTKVFFGRTGGWDTHVRQVDTSNATIGAHRTLLESLSGNLKAFQEDLDALGLSDRVTTVVFSEFGRKIIQNGSRGTDHGTLSSMFVVGKHVEGGVYGENINLDFIDTQGAPDAAQLENDYRGVFSSLLRDWMGADQGNVGKAFPNTDEDILLDSTRLIKAENRVDPSCYFAPIPPSDVNIRLNVWLEGLFDKETGKMKANLVTNQILPNTQPFANNYFGYFENESVETFPAGTVDWVLLELRTKESFITVARKACLIDENGWVMGLDGNKKITFTGLYPDEYHVAVFHPSHLAVLSREMTIPDADETQLFNLDAPDKVFGPEQLKSINGTYVMVSGDVDQNGAINTDDYLLVRSDAGSKGYHDTDLNRDGFVRKNEMFKLNANRSRIGFPGLFERLKS